MSKGMQVMKQMSKKYELQNTQANQQSISPFLLQKMTKSMMKQ